MCWVITLKANARALQLDAARVTRVACTIRSGRIQNPYIAGRQNRLRFIKLITIDTNQFIQIMCSVHIEVEEAHLVVRQNDCLTRQAVFNGENELGHLLAFIFLRDFKQDANSPKLARCPIWGASRNIRLTVSNNDNKVEHSMVTSLPCVLESQFLL